MPEPKDTPSQAAPAKKSIEQEIEDWFREHFHDSVISRAGGDIYELAHSAKEKLKARLAALH